MTQLNILEYQAEPESETAHIDGEVLESTSSEPNDIGSALVVLNDPSPQVLAMFSSENGLDPLIEAIKQRVITEDMDVTTKKGRERIGSVAREIGSAKVKMAKFADSLTEEKRKQVKLVTSEKTRMEREMDALRDQILAPREEFEAREQKRVDTHMQRIEAMRETVRFEGFATPNVDDLKSGIATLEKLYKIDFANAAYDWEEFADRASEVYTNTLDHLNFMLTERIKYEAEQAELERLRKEQAEREQKERDAKIAQEAAEKARKEAEEKAAEEARVKAEQEQAEKDRLQKEKEESEAARIAAEERHKTDLKEAEEKAKREAEAAAQRERDRQAEEQRKQKELDDARARDLAHRKKIDDEAIAAIIKVASILDANERAAAIVKAIAEGKIPHITIKY